MKKVAAVPAPLPEFQTDRMRLLGPLITPRVMELAYIRLRGTKFVASKGVKKEEFLQVDDEEWVLKIALIVVLEMWPHQRFTVEEEGIMRGMGSDNVNPHKKEGLIRPF